MIGALWTGISGLGSHQTALDNESHNIANVNTVGYKAGRVSFADQVYQNKIGKGGFIQDAEKIFNPGSFKMTGVSYDAALMGDGFFTVVNKNTLGTAETYFTRAGNFRMGENGYLQTAGGYEVQGWIMSEVDVKNDVKSTDQNATRFTNDFTKAMGYRIVRHKDYIETIAAKSSDFNVSSRSDAQAVFSGAGYKTKSSKLKDVQLGQKYYEQMLQKYKEEPNALSIGSTKQISQINFKTGVAPTSILQREGDNLKVTIDGRAYTQSYVISKTSDELRLKLWEQLQDGTDPNAPTDERALYGLTDPVTVNAMPTGTATQRAARDVEIAKYDMLMGRINTYKAMADNISNSELGGMVAYLARDKTKGHLQSDVLNPNDIYEESTNYGDMLRGVIQIEGLIPGQKFSITSVTEHSVTNDKLIIRGDHQTTADAVQGSGKAAIDSAREALARLMSGKQQSVYETQQIFADNTAALPAVSTTYNFHITIYDKTLGYNIPVPNDGLTPPNPVNINIPVNEATTDLALDSLVNQINSLTIGTGPQLGSYIVAKNVNGNLVLETNDANYDVEFIPSLTNATISPLKLYEVNPDLSGRKGAGAEFMEITTRIDQASMQGSIQLRLDTLNVSDNKFGKYRMDETGLITIEEGGVEIAVGQVSIGRFVNNRGLEAVGDNNFKQTQLSGYVNYSMNNHNTDGVKSNALELSEAKLSDSLVNLMVFQRAFEANAKSITTSDELLSTLLNLKR